MEGGGGTSNTQFLGQPSPLGGAPSLGQAKSYVPGLKQNLPPGYANVQGEIMYTGNKVIQRVSASGSNYYKFVRIQ